MPAIISINQFKRKYFPVAYEEERISKMSPEELGKHLANKTLKIIEEVCK